MKKPLVYIFIAIINWVFLRYLLKISTDTLDVQIEESYTGIGILIITIVTFLSLVGMRVFVFIVRKKTLQEQTKIKVATIITLTISSFLYVHYLTKYKNDIIANGNFRNQIALKVKKSDWFFGTQAINLTLKEYQEIKRKIKKLPNLPREATSIDYYYEYDGFLSDYNFSLEYNLPKHVKLDTVNYKKDGYTKTQSFIFLKNKKRIKYSEVQI